MRTSDELPQIPATFSWQYVAGFFDGEGTVSATQNGKYGYSPRVEFAQSGEIGMKVLGAIQNFLTSFGIVSIIGTVPPKRLSKLPSHCLRLTSRKDISQFLPRVLPYLITKKVEAQDLARRMVVFPSLASQKTRLAWESRRANLKEI